MIIVLYIHLISTLYTMHLNEIIIIVIIRIKIDTHTLTYKQIIKLYLRMKIKQITNQFNYP